MLHKQNEIKQLQQTIWTGNTPKKKTADVHIYGSMMSVTDHQRWVNEKQSYEAIIPTHKKTPQTNKKK